MKKLLCVLQLIFLFCLCIYTSVNAEANPVIPSDEEIIKIAKETILKSNPSEREYKITKLIIVERDGHNRDRGKQGTGTKVKIIGDTGLLRNPSDRKTSAKQGQTDH